MEGVTMEASYWISDCDTYCSDCAPKGSTPAFQPEADCPQHCAECHELLDCAMTSDGLAYVADKLLDGARDGSGTPSVLLDWLNRYPEARKLLGRDEVQELVEERLRLRQPASPEGSRS